MTMKRLFASLRVSSARLRVGRRCYDPPPQYPAQPVAYQDPNAGYQDPNAQYQDPGPPPDDATEGTDLPVDEPAPIAADYGPPALIDESEPPSPYYGAVWVPGFWGWDAGWGWRRGRWAAAPIAGYGWCAPYYENRGGAVIFVSGHWRASGSVFVPPRPGMYIARSPYRARPGFFVGAPARSLAGGVFVPPPHGRPVTAIVAAGPRPVFVAPPAGARVIPARPGGAIGVIGGGHVLAHANLPPPSVNRGYSPAPAPRPYQPYSNGTPTNGGNPTYKPVYPPPAARPMRPTYAAPTVQRSYTPPRITPQRSAPAPSFHASVSVSAPASGGHHR